MEQSLFNLDTESRRYSRYARRIARFRHTLDWAKGHWLLMTVIALLITAAVIGFLLIIGTFTGALTCDSLIYGETPSCSIRAFLSEVHYQFAPAEGEAVWSNHFPTAPGEYRIRAVSKNGFGQKKYSNDVTFTLLPRDLNVLIHDGTFVYGDFSSEVPAKHTQITGLIPGDQAQPAEYACLQDDGRNYSVSLKSLQILNGAGQDVTACYRISGTDGFFTMTPRPITVKSQDASKVYDDEEWNLAQAAIAEGSLADNDTLQITFSPAPAAAGRHILKPQCAVLNESGQDISFCYQITTESGYLTVERRPLTIETGSAEKEYDGTPLTNSQWSLVEGNPVQEHTLKVTPSGTQTAAGNSPNTIQLTVLDAAGMDVTENYAITLKAGTLTVTPITLTFKTGSAKKVYDGLELSENTWSHVTGKLLPLHTLSCYTTGMQLNAGSSNNTLSVTVLDAKGRNVTAAGYRIEVDYGTLTVTPRPITITSDSAEKLYDGWPLICHSYQLPIDTFDFGTWDEYIIRSDFTGSQTKVGSSPNTFTVEIADYYGEITTFNYDITYIYGTLTVLENPNPPDISTPIDPGDHDPGDPGDPGPGTTTPGDPGDAPPQLGSPTEGTEIGFPGDVPEVLFAQAEGYSGFPTAQLVYFRYLSYGEYTGSGWGPATPYTSGDPLMYVGLSLRENASIQIHRINNCPALLPYFTMRSNTPTPQVSDCYYSQDRMTYNVDMTFGYDYRDLKYTQISPRLAAQELSYRQFVHRQYLQIPASTKKALLEWAQQNGIRADSPTLVEDIQVAILNAATYNAKGTPYPKNVDVAVYFLTVAKEGICQHFATAATMVYRAFGIPARYTTGFADTVQKNTTTNLTSQDAHAWVEIYVDGLGWVPMEVTGGGGAGFGGTGDPSQSTKTELYIQACSATKMYDGKPFDIDELDFVILGGKLRQGHQLEITMAVNSSATIPGIYRNQITRCVIYDENGIDVTAKYYNIHCIDGELTIMPRKITVTLGSATKIYDGHPLVCTDFWVSQGSLLPGHELRIVFDRSQLYPGTTINTTTDIRVVGIDNTGYLIQYSSYYDITIIDGTLTILPDDS